MKKYPVIVVKNVLIDMDGTLTETEKESSYYNDIVENDYLTGILADIIIRKEEISFREAIEKIIKNKEENVCLFDIAKKKFAISEKEYFEKIVLWHKKCLHIYPDGVEMVKKLGCEGFNLYTATTNSKKVTLTKLHNAGLASQTSSPYFKDFFGGDSIKSCYKTDPEFYINILESANILPEDTVMIGDNIEADCKVPQKAGIEKSIIVDRNQREEFIVYNSNNIFVNSLSLVPRIINLSI